jgi:osmotically-inducible protein OsmY
MKAEMRANTGGGQYDNQYGGEYGSSEFGSSGSGMSYTGGLSRSRQRYGSAPSSLGATRNRPSDMTGGYPEEPWRSMSANPSAREYYGSGSSSSSTSSRRGKAPRGYKRSDERIREDICERMMDNGELDASDVEIEVHEGVVKLSGNCSCRHSKNAIEEIVDGVSGVNDIDNQIKVKRSNGKDDESSSSTSTTSQSAKSGIGAAATSQGSSLGGSGAQTSRTRG